MADSRESGVLFIHHDTHGLVSEVQKVPTEFVIYQDRF